LKSTLAAFGAVVALGAASVAQAQATPHTPQIKFEPVGSAPSVPAGLQTACLKVPDDGAQLSTTCPVIHYGANTTWVFSYADNRLSFALVTFDPSGKVLQNVERQGGRYAFDVFSDDKGQKLIIVGQSKNVVVANWSDLPH
jgi:hypothetical protein